MQVAALTRKVRMTGALIYLSQCRIKVGAIDAAALGPLLKIGPPS